MPDWLRTLPERLAALDDAPTSSLPGGRLAAVLLLLYPGASGPSFVLTQRPDTMSRHPGQVALPGGLAEPEDVSLWDTALREAREEVGYTGTPQPLGQLSTLPMRIGGTLIVPFVAWDPQPPQLVPHEREVAAIYAVSLADLLRPDAIGQEVREFRDQSWRIALYRLPGVEVWGATAHILADFHRRLTGADLGPFPPGSVRAIAASGF